MKIEKAIAIGLTALWAISMPLHWLADILLTVKINFTVLIALIIYLIWAQYFSYKSHGKTIDMWGDTIDAWKRQTIIYQAEIKFLKNKLKGGKKKK